MGISPDEFAYIQALVQSAVSIFLEPQKGYLVESRLIPLAANHGFKSLSDLISFLKITHPTQLHRDVVEAMLTNETQFFRDALAFDALRNQVLPQLMEKRQNERHIHIWCCACSSGQEPYSLAMLIEMYFRSTLSWEFHIFASDFSQKILKVAKQGCYSSFEVARGLPPEYLQKFFRKCGESWQLVDDIRKMVEFKEINVMRPLPSLPKMDVIFLRNILIYFENDKKKVILDALGAALKEDGYLFLGNSETILGLESLFEHVQIGNTIAYKLKAKRN